MTQEQQSNYLASYIVDKMVIYLMKDFGLTMANSLNIVYTSELFEKLHAKDSYLLSQSPAYNYELLKNEFERGCLQPYCAEA